MFLVKGAGIIGGEVLPIRGEVLPVGGEVLPVGGEVLPIGGDWRSFTHWRGSITHWRGNWYYPLEGAAMGPVLLAASHMYLYSACYFFCRFWMGLGTILCSCWHLAKHKVLLPYGRGLQVQVGVVFRWA